MATYPAALHSFTAKVDNVDDVLAADVNTAYDEIIALETELGTDPAGSLTDVKTRLAVSLAADGDLTLTGSSTLTISSGAITATNNLHKVAVESGSADDLDTITAAADGYVLVLSCADSSKPITLRHNAGNILNVGGKNITMRADGDMVTLIYSTALSKWRCNYSGKRMPVTVTKTANYTATINDDNIFCDATSGALTITLPAATSSIGLTLNIKKIDTSINAVILDGNASETIDGATTLSLYLQYSSVQIVCDGTAWYTTMHEEVNTAHLMQSDSTDQAIANVTLAQVITFDTNVAAEGITRTSSSRFTIRDPGHYLITFSGVATGTINKLLEVWLRVDGSDIASSNTIYSFKTSGGVAVIAASFIHAFTSGQYFEFWTWGDDVSSKWDATAAGSSPTRPACPSVIITCNKIGN